MGADSDLLIGTNQSIVKSRLDAVKKGIGILRDITGIDKIILITAGESMQGFGHIGAQVKNIDTAYPAALPQMIMKNVLGEVVPAGKTCADLGVCFMTAEAAASIGKAFSDGQIPVRKIVTLVTKDGNQRLIETVIGTPIRDILNTYGVSINEEDRIMFGGPMAGSAVYSLDHPVLPDTNGIVVIDRSDAAYASDYPCINCGECVRVCPARIQVHMLVRFLEAGHYEEGADNYDLFSCIECGLCSFVCVSKIPIFQYIKLAKYELDRQKLQKARKNRVRGNEMLEQKKLIVSHAPFWHNGSRITNRSYHTMLAALPAVLAGFITTASRLSVLYACRWPRPCSGNWDSIWWPNDRSPSATAMPP